MLKAIDRFCFRSNLCCILRGPSGKPIVDVVSGRTKLEPQIKTEELGRLHALAIIPPSSVLAFIERKE